MADGMNDFDRVECPGCGMMLRPLYEGHVCTGPEPLAVPAAPRPVWWRLDNPDDVRVEILHRDPHEHDQLQGDRVCYPPQHYVRVTQTDTRHLDLGCDVHTTRVASAELVVRPDAEFAALFAAGRITPRMLHLCMAAPPALGVWTRIEPLDDASAPHQGPGIVGGVRDQPV